MTQRTISQQISRGVAFGCAMLLVVILCGSIYAAWLRASLDSQYSQLEGGPLNPDVE